MKKSSGIAVGELIGILLGAALSALIVASLAYSASLLPVSVVPKEQAGGRMFHAKRVRREHTIILNGTPAELFPLFGPVEEAKWAEGWNPTFIYPPDGSIGEGAVFSTNHDSEAYWILTEYKPEILRIAYVYIAPASRATQITIRLESAAGGRSAAGIAYIHTALTEAGNAYIEACTAEHYRREINHWQAAINHCLLRGERLRHH